MIPTLIAIAMVAVALSGYLDTIAKEDHDQRYNEAEAPSAQRSGPPLGGWNPTTRQIRENDLPRYIDEDGNVRTIERQEDGTWH